MVQKLSSYDIPVLQEGSASVHTVKWIERWFHKHWNDVKFFLVHPQWQDLTLDLVGPILLKKPKHESSFLVFEKVVWQNKPISIIL